jgi:hypothetical protein
MAAVARGVWAGLDQLLGRSVVAQIVAMGIALIIAGALYAWLVLSMRIPEARQIQSLLVSRLRGSGATR